MDNEIVELHPPLVTFASVEYNDGDPLPAPNQIPPPPAPYDHKHNLVVVNKNDLESILVSKHGAAAQQNANTAISAFPPQAANNPQQAAYKKQYIYNTVSGLELLNKTYNQTKPKILTHSALSPGPIQ